MSILVTGGTGTVGSAVVKELVARGAELEVLTRDASKFTPTRGVTPVQGNLLEPETVNRVFKGIDRVFLLNPVSQTEASEALMAITGMRVSTSASGPCLSSPAGYASAWM